MLEAHNKTLWEELVGGFLPHLAARFPHGVRNPVGALALPVVSLRDRQAHPLPAPQTDTGNP